MIRSAESQSQNNYLLYTAHQMDRLGRFLSFQLEPTAEDYPDALIVLATSPYSQSTSFAKRITTTLQYAQYYPFAKILLSGKHPDVSRAFPHELAPEYSEAAIMREQVIKQGLSPKKLLPLEDESTNTRENVFNSLDKLSPLSKSVLFICDKLQGRRVYYYFQKYTHLHPEFQHVKCFLIDASLQQQNPLDQEHIHYEASRLFSYRRKGDL